MGLRRPMWDVGAKCLGIGRGCRKTVEVNEFRNREWKSYGRNHWRMPIGPAYDKLINSQIADIKNVGEGRWGGAITAAKFLENFVAEVPWVHLDIAGPAFADGPKAHRDAGATGVMVRTLVRWLETR